MGISIYNKLLIDTGCNKSVCIQFDRLLTRRTFKNSKEHQGEATKAKRKGTFLIDLPLTTPKGWLEHAGQYCGDLILHPSRMFYRVSSLLFSV